MRDLSTFVVLVWLLVDGTYSFSPTPHGSNVQAGVASATKLLAIETRHEDEPSRSRRQLLQWSSGAALSAYILGQPVIPVLAESPNTILMTGSNSGLGFQAALRLAQAGHDLILPCRTFDRSRTTVERLKSDEFFGGGSLVAAECNLASMSSISACAKELQHILPEGKLLDCVCLNAGLARNTEAKDVLRTEEGFELTVGTNHFGHFYLNHLLLPKLQPDGGRVVITASGVHDPASPGGAQGVPATLGELEGLQRDGRTFDMVDGSEFNADKAYKDSKLCNVLFTRELQRRLDSSPTTSKITANCFNPGLIVSTGLFRDQNPLFTKAFDFAATGLFKVGETPVWGGAALAYMTNVHTKGRYYSSPPGSSKYGETAFGNQFQISDVSIEAQDDAKAKRLWDLSEKLLGITT